MDKEKSLAVKVGVVIGIILILVIAFESGVFNGKSLAVGTGGNGNSNNNNASSQYANTVGTFWVYQNNYNGIVTSSSISTSYSTGAGFVFYALRGGSYVPLGGSWSTYTQVETTTADNGVIYAVATLGSTATYLFDAAKTAQANSAITAINYQDITGSGNPEFVCTVSLNQVPKPASGYPELTLTGFWFANAIEGDVSLSNGVTGNAIECTTNPQSNYIEWALTCSHSDALAFYKIQIKFNDISTGDVKVTQATVPTVGGVAGSAMKYWYDSSYQYFEYTIGTGTLGDCAYMTWQQNAPAKQYVDATIQTGNLAGNVTATWTMFALDYDGSTSSISDSVVFYPGS